MLNGSLQEGFLGVPIGTWLTWLSTGIGLLILAIVFLQTRSRTGRTPATPAGAVGLSGSLTARKIPAPGSGGSDVIGFSTEGQGEREIAVPYRPIRLSFRVPPAQSSPIEVTEDDLPASLPVGRAWLRKRALIVRRFTDTGFVIDEQDISGVGVQVYVLEAVQPSTITRPQDLLASEQGRSPVTPSPQESLEADESITPEYLVGLYQQHTLARAQALVAPYTGTSMEISGTLENVISWPPSDSIAFVRGRPSGYGPSLRAMVTLHFRGEWAERVNALDRGSSIRVRGRIKEVTPSGVVLDDCELLEP